MSKLNVTALISVGIVVGTLLVIGAFLVAGPRPVAATNLSLSERNTEVLPQVGIPSTGRATKLLPPDIVYLQLRVVARAAGVSEARDEASEAMASVLAALKELGLKDDDLQTTQFKVTGLVGHERVEIEGSSGRTIYADVLAGYEVSNGLLVVIRDLDILGDILTKATEAGGNTVRIDNLKFAIDDAQRKYEDDLIADAVKDARQRAEYLAELAGVALGDAVFVEKSFHSPTHNDRYRRFDELQAVPTSGSFEVPIEFGVVEVAVLANVEFAIKLAD